MNEDELLRLDLTKLNDGDLTPIKQCAQWQNNFLREHGYPVYSNAWNLIGVIPVFNGYENTQKPESYNRDEYLTLGLTAANNIYNNFDTLSLDTNQVYVLNMQHFPSSAMEQAYNDGHDYSLGTHTGMLYYPANVYSKGSKHGASRWQVAHNVSGNIHVDKFNTLQYSGNPSLHNQGTDVAFVTSIMRPVRKGRLTKAKETIVKTGKKAGETLKTIRKYFPIMVGFLPK